MKNYSITPEKYLTPAEQSELERILEKYRKSDLRNTTMLLLMLKGGPRPSEVLNLTWADIGEGWVFFETLKGGPPRKVPISSNLVSRFAELGPGLPDERMFPIGIQQFTNIWYDYRPCKKKLHSLRHTFAVNAYRKGDNQIHLVQQALGHVNIQTTAIYLQIQSTLEELRSVID